MSRFNPWIIALLALLTLGGLAFVVVTTSSSTATSTTNPTASPSTTLPTGPTTTTPASTTIPGPSITLPPTTTTTTTPSAPTTTTPRTPTTTQPRSTSTTTSPQVDPLAVTTTALPSAVATEAYSFTLSGSGGVRPYVWSVSGLPAGLSFDSATGLISGTVPTPGNHLLTFTLYDSASASTSTNLTLIVTPAPLVIDAVSLPAATKGSPFSFTPSASGGTPPYVWSVSGLPDGLSFDSATGLISGTPTAVGESSITFSVSDGIRQASVTAELAVVPPPVILDLTAAPIPHPSLGVPYTLDLNDFLSGGQAPYIWFGFGLPPGLSLNSSTGVVSGQASGAGSFNFSVSVGDGYSTTQTTVELEVSAARLCEHNTSIPDLECLALSALADSSNLEDVAEEWATLPDPCDWPGVACADGHVDSLVFRPSTQFGSKVLELTLPSELRHLTHLNTLAIFHQTVSGALPAELGELSELRALDIVLSGLSGEIPESLGQLSALELLDLSHNNLSGAIPDSLGNLSNLHHLFLEGNDLTGTIPASLAGLTYLHTLSLAANNLSGPVPDIFEDLRYLLVLFLHNNNLSGELPTSLFSGAGGLISLSLGGNDCLHTADAAYAAWLSSKNPGWDAACPTIDPLSVSFFLGTETSVALTASSGSAPYSWELTEGPDWLSLDPDTGLLTGTPTTVGPFSFTVQLTDDAGGADTVSFNLEVGPAPGCAANTSISDLECLALSKIAANSNLADEFGWADDLTQPCDWQGVSCEGSGVVDISLSADTGFNTLDVSLALPAEIAYLSNLRSLVVTNQLFTEPLPSEIGLLSSITRLDLHSSGLPGEIPASVGNLANLTYLNLYINFLTGPIPDSLGNLSNLEFLSLTTNRLDGTVPTSLANLTSLSHLDLSDNALEGEIPDIFSDLDSLEVLRLRYNFFDGPLPTSLTALGNLAELTLYGNGCFTTEDNLADWVEVFDPDWEDGCPKIGDLALATFIGNNFTRSFTVSGGRWPYTWSLLDGPDWLSLDPDTGVLSGLASEVGTFPLTVQVSGTRGYTDTRTFTLTVHNVERCKNNTQIPDLECVALDAMVVPFAFAQLPWTSTTSPCGWQGVSCDLDSDGRGNVTRVVVGPETFFSDGDVWVNLPPEIRYLSHLQELSVDSQTILTEIPPEIGQLSALKTLFIYDSALTGKIPSEVGNLSNLEVLVLGVNSLSGALPASLNQLTNLQVLNVESNSFTGSIPALSNLTGLLLLSVADNQLSGAIPDMFSSAMGELIVLDFSSNQLSGVLPESLLDLPKLAALKLAPNGCFTTANTALRELLDEADPNWQDGCG